jgi:purine-binding chemotaxis protein CheW
MSSSEAIHDPATVPLHGDATQLLAFVCGGHRWAVDVLQVREVVEPRTVTRVPDAPPWALGVMSLRGRAVPVVDLARRLGLDDAGAERPYVLVAEIANGEGGSSDLGLRVDGVDEVWTPPEGRIDEPPSFGIPIHPSYLRGVTEYRGEPALLVDLDRVLSAEELLEALAAGEP